MADTIVNGHLSTEKESEQSTTDPTNDVPEITEENKKGEIRNKEHVMGHCSSEEMEDNDEQSNTISNEAVINDSKNNEQIPGNNGQEKGPTSANIQNELSDDEGKATTLDTSQPNPSQMKENDDKNTAGKQSENVLENPTDGSHSEQNDVPITTNDQRNASVEANEATSVKESENVNRDTVSDENETSRQKLADDSSENQNLEAENSGVEEQKVGIHCEVKLECKNENEVKNGSNTKEIDGASSVRSEQEETDKKEENTSSKETVVDRAHNEKEQPNDKKMKESINAQPDIQPKLENEQSSHKEFKENTEMNNQESKGNTNEEIIQPTLQEQPESSPHTDQVFASSTTPAVEIEKNENVEAVSCTSGVAETAESGSAERKLSSSIWYTDEAEREAQSPKPEGYSTTVVGGVVVRKPLPSSSSPEHKKTSPSPIGSKFKMSFGSFFGKRISLKSENKLGEASGTQEDSGKDSMNAATSNEDIVKNEGEEMGNGVEKVKEVEKEELKVDVEVVEQSKKVCTPAENCLEMSESEQTAKDVQEKNPEGGEIVPLEQGVTKADDEQPAESEPTASADQPIEIEPDDAPVDEDRVLRERIAKRDSFPPTHSPEKRMQMRVSYAGGSKDGEKEVEVIGTREVPKRPQNTKSNVPSLNRCSCRELGDVDHEGWLVKRGGGSIFATWKRKWVVLKERHLYYFKTSFDLEAGDVIFLDEKCKIAAAPELKRKFAFKVDNDDPKAHKLFLAADTKAAMDTWLSVLTAASRGEVIIRNTKNEKHDNVRMRKKTGSMTKRAGSVLGIGGLYDYDGTLQKTTSPTHRRASFGSAPKELHHSLTAITSDGEDEQSKEPLNKQEESKHDEANSDDMSSSETAKDLSRNESVSEVIAEDKDESQIKNVNVHETVEIEKVGETQSVDVTEGKTENSTKETPEELVMPHDVPVAATLQTTEEELSIAPLEQVAETTVSVKQEDKEKSEADVTITEQPSIDVEKQIDQSKNMSSKKNQSELKIEDQSEIRKESSTENSQSQDMTESNQSQTTSDNNQSQKKLETHQSQDKLENNQSQNALQRSQSEQKKQSKSQSQDRNSKRMSKSDSTSSFKSKTEKYNTWWYFVLDAENDKWMDFQFKPKNTDDELLFMVQNIKNARITITGVPLPGNEQRGRAMSLVSEQNSEILKLNALTRSLKEKERELNAMDELLCQDINRQSIYEWSSRYTYLTEELASQSETSSGKTRNSNDVDAKTRENEGKKAQKTEDSGVTVVPDEDPKITKTEENESEDKTSTETKDQELQDRKTDASKDDGSQDEDVLQSESKDKMESKNKLHQDENTTESTQSKESNSSIEQQVETSSQEQETKEELNKKDDKPEGKEDTEDVDNIDTKL